MIGLLVTLILINNQIRNLNPGIIKASFGIYLGWICIATIANVTAFLVNANWNGFGISHEAWTIIMIFSGLLIAALSVYNLRNPFIGFAVVWAFIGIAIKRQDDYRPIFLSALIAMSLMALVTLWGFLRKAAS